MLITIGILAHNEAERIGQTIESLFSQSVFLEPSRIEAARWQIVVVPNGCTDRTAEHAKRALQAAVEHTPHPNVGFVIDILDRPGKSNAWNELIHRVADIDTDFFVMMDADIEFGHPDTIANSITTLLATPSALVVVDKPLKDFTRRSNLNVLERISLYVSRTSNAQGIAGSFYCARAAALRSVWMPIGLSVEDGFLAAMIQTDNFRGAPDASRIVRAEDASHYFEGLSRVRSVIMHEVRLVIGTLLNCYLCWDALLFLTPSNGEGAGPVIRNLNDTEPNWYARMMANQIAARGLWIIPSAMLFRRWISWWSLPWSKKIVRLPLTVATFAFDLIVLTIANWKMVSGRSIGLW